MEFVVAIALAPTLFTSTFAFAACPIIFDGRLSSGTVTSDFDKPTSIYNQQYVHGQNQTWADVIEFPSTMISLFDSFNDTIPIEIILSDESVFAAGGAPQVGLRRSELIPAVNTGTDATVNGTTTFHWSIRADPSRPLNFSHEYHPIWHEKNDFSSSQFILQTGTPFSDASGTEIGDPQTFRLTGRRGANNETTLFTTSFSLDVWHNFAIAVGWDSNLVEVYYSNGTNPLRKVAGPTFNDNSGGGQVHVGMLKLPTGSPNIDTLHEGYQESGIDEGLIFGGIFIEDSSHGCVTLAT